MTKMMMKINVSVVYHWSAVSEQDTSVVAAAVNYSNHSFFFEILRLMLFLDGHVYELMMMVFESSSSTSTPFGMIVTFFSSYY